MKNRLSGAVLRALCGLIFAGSSAISASSAPPDSLLASNIQASEAKASLVSSASYYPAGSPDSIAKRYGNLPLSFEANHGQSDARVKYISRGQGYSLFLTSSEAVLALSKSPAGADVHNADKSGAATPSNTSRESSVIRLRFIGANDAPEITRSGSLPGKSNYLTGNDPGQWHTDVTHYSQVRYADLYPGIDLVYYGNQRQLEYDFVVAPGIDHRIIKHAYQGADKLSIDAQGNLLLNTGNGVLKQHRPVIYQAIDGKRIPVDGHYIHTGKHQIGFQIARYDTAKPLVIDPVLSYSTYLGGNDNDRANDIAVDSAGNAYVTGETLSTVFPLLAGAFDIACGIGIVGCSRQVDAFVTKLNAAGNALVYSTFLGGNGMDFGMAIAVDSSGNAYVTGTTMSTDFPTTASAFDRTCGVGVNTCASAFLSDLFVTKLNAAGNGVVYSTFLGGSQTEGDGGLDIAVNASGEAFLTGNTSSIDFPRVNALQATPGGSEDAFVTRLAAAGNVLLYSTYLGGAGNDSGNGIAVDASSNAHITGATNSRNFPVTNGAFNRTFSTLQDAFVAKLLPAGNALAYSTYLGGNEIDSANAIALDGSGNVYITGATLSADFPTTTGAFDTVCGTGGVCNSYRDEDAFVTKLSPSASGLVYSTFLGGSGIDRGTAIAVDSTGSAYITGHTGSLDFNTLSSTQSANGGDWDVFVTRLAPAGNALAFSTYLGGSKSDFGNGIAIDASGNAYITGATLSANFPTTISTFDSSCGTTTTCAVGTEDSFIARIAFPAQDGAVTPPPPVVVPPPPVVVPPPPVIVPPPVGTVQFTAGNYSVNETGGTAIIIVTRTGESSGAISVGYATSNGSATAGSDYTASSGIISFAAGELSKKIVVAITNDTVLESGETVNLRLSAPSGATLGTPATAVLTISDDDSAAPGADSDGDNMTNEVEAQNGTDPTVKDNDVFSQTRMFAMQQYRDFLGREGDSAGITHWTSLLNNGMSRPQVIENFFNSPEFQGNAAPITRLYFAYFRRIPDYAGLLFHISRYRSRLPLATISQDFANSAEFTRTYGSLDNSAFVRLVYNNVLGRAPDSSGFAYWTGELNSGRLSRGQVMVGFSESVEFKARIHNSVYVTMMYVGMLRRAPERAGFDGWVSYLKAGNSGLNLIGGFLNALEYRNRFLL